MAPRHPLPHAFTPETAPRQGGKKGRKATKTKARAMAERMIEERMQSLFNRSMENVAQAIEGVPGDGTDENPGVAPDVRMSAWFVETHLKMRGTRMADQIKAQIKTLEDVERASIETVEKALAGEITLEQAKAIQEMISRHMALSGAVELTKLRDDLEAYKTDHGIGTKNTVDHMPAWGRLQEITSRPVEKEVIDDAVAD